ncbi:MAG: ABC transporter substrate-binding protein, partial [Armatimonadota bacterium]|nr:ABC transporter substrate-binding protein [Armatimonadota bacterium]
MKAIFREGFGPFLAMFLLGLMVSVPLRAGPAGEVTVGAVYPLSGALASTAKLSRDGIEFAVDIINKRYDLALPLARSEGLPNLGGAKIRVIFGDTQGSPEVGRAETERLITGEKVVAVVGAYQSAVTATASMAAERLSVPFLNPDSTSPTLIQRGFEWFFRATPDDDIMSKNFFDFLKDLETKKGVRVRTVALVCENTLWGTDVCKFERKYAKDYGYEVVAEMLYPARSTDLSSEVQRLKAVRPDVVFMASYIS